MNNAFYYENSYFLLPEGYTDYREFFAKVSKGPFPVEVYVVALRENHKIPNYGVQKGVSTVPYFLSGYHDEPVKVEIADPEDLYPVRVEICTQEEYNAMMRRKILEFCPGCLRYKPLSNRVQSLNGHFEEMAPDGVCFFRQETKPSPRAFHNHLYSFGGFYMNFGYYDLPALEMKDRLKEWFYVRYTGAEICRQAGFKELLLTLPKKELLLPVLTDAISQYLQDITHGEYRIRHTAPVADMKAYLETVLSEANREIFRKDCKKFGISIGMLEYAPEAEEKIFRSIEAMIDRYWLFPLLKEAGREYYLIADTTYVLKELRYRTPLLETYGAKISVYGQYGSRRYEIAFSMPGTEI